MDKIMGRRIIDLFKKKKVKVVETNDTVDDPTVGLDPYQLTDQDKKDFFESRSVDEDVNICHFCHHSKKDHSPVCEECLNLAQKDKNIVVCGKFE